MDSPPDFRASLKECSAGHVQTALAKSVVSFTLEFQEPKMGQANITISTRYTTFFTISREYLSLFGSFVTVAAAIVNTSRLALHCHYSMRPVVYIRSILLSAPQIVSQALTFDFRPSGCELEDCHSDGHKSPPELSQDGV
ncbi:hypothetical protein D6D04_07999 [Aureobasidium pullulans]|nr:hypothetical protein D6D04_07999 [Aureobasidium pullulans]